MDHKNKIFPLIIFGLFITVFQIILRKLVSILGSELPRRDCQTERAFTRNLVSILGSEPTKHNVPIVFGDFSVSPQKDPNYFKEIEQFSRSRSDSVYQNEK